MVKEYIVYLFNVKAIKRDGGITFLALQILQNLRVAYHEIMKEMAISSIKHESNLMVFTIHTEIMSEQVFELCIKRGAHIG